MMFYLRMPKKEFDEWPFFSKLGYCEYGIGIEVRSDVPVSMAKNDIIEALERRH